MGVLVFFLPGTLEQLVLGLIVCFLYSGLCAFLWPYDTKTDNLMAMTAQTALFVTMVSAVVVEHGNDSDKSVVTQVLIVAALCSISTWRCVGCSKA